MKKTIFDYTKDELLEKEQTLKDEIKDACKTKKAKALFINNYYAIKEILNRLNHLSEQDIALSLQSEISTQKALLIDYSNILRANNLLPDPYGTEKRSE